MDQTGTITGDLEDLAHIDTAHLMIYGNLSYSDSVIGLPIIKPNCAA
jgi:hypothetical protein